MKIIFNALVIAGISLFSAGCGPEGIGPDWHRVEPRVAARELTLPTLDGASIRLADLKGRVVVMEFWATWCGPCRFSLPSLEVIQKRYRDRGVTVLLVNQGETAEAIRRWAKQRFTAIIALDREGRIGQAYGVNGIPRLVIVDQDGRLAYVHEGYGGGLEHNLTLILEALLAMPHPPRGASSASAAGKGS